MRLCPRGKISVGVQGSGRDFLKSDPHNGSVIPNFTITNHWQLLSPWAAFFAADYRLRVYLRLNLRGGLHKTHV